MPMSVEKKTYPDKKTGREISFEDIRSGAGLQFRPPGRMAKAKVEGSAVLSQTPARAALLDII